MLVLGIDSSATAASAALLEDEKLIVEYFVNTKQTHSQTLLPMVESLLSTVGKSCADLDVIGVSQGPGSFTGVRIGVSCVKGMALPNTTPCCGVSTLEAIAYGGVSCEGAVLCAVMDARCQQVYNAMFRVENGCLSRLCEDRALSIEALGEECRKYGEKLVLLGDGAVICHKSYKDWGARLVPEAIRYQRGASVAFITREMALKGETVPPEKLLPSYLRLPQAERELKKRMEKEGNE